LPHPLHPFSFRRRTGVVVVGLIPRLAARIFIERQWKQEKVASMRKKSLGATFSSSAY